MIREARSQDAQCLTALALQVWLTTYTTDGMRDEYAAFALATFTPDYFKKIINNKDNKLLVYERDSAVLGFLLINFTSHHQGQDNGFEVEKLYVHSGFQGQGIGRQLLDELSKRYGDRYWLYTWVENDSNVFYQRLGFEKIGEISFQFAGHDIHNNVYRSPTN
ncbi:GNAT family N-acetyltransferase [Pseudoalteromonas luteoviolacea]|uniref:N-acetyltransferase domain-containing protein n=1 Tax=Pseudoalteromonas luteoviolacea H33 TaxID=1365251 RepID=A0A161Y169_9GAMM|nr:N-acetyltransferase [Pseudoalteromonas luteoviolacea]KZN49740.1 hypothetical protein N476_18280 [Pseudoalteromonas luteoviolacea H33]KZN77764.1 hypothetical protein N477_00735 [Pseudoalteromonas luteoviolacea H33-S]